MQPEGFPEIRWYGARLALEKCGFSEPPKTWDEMKQMGDKVTQDQAIKNGFVFQGSQYEGGVVNGLEYINSYGGSVLDPDDASKVVIDSPDSVQRLETAASIVGDGISPQALTNYTETESQSVFLNGDSVFLRGWPYMYSLAGNPEEADIEQNQVGIASMPAGSAGSVSGLGGWNFYINASSDVQDAAYAFIEFAPPPSSRSTGLWKAVSC